jgi:hypothetical protein
MVMMRTRAVRDGRGEVDERKRRRRRRRPMRLRSRLGTWICTSELQVAPAKEDDCILHALNCLGYALTAPTLNLKQLSAFRAVCYPRPFKGYLYVQHSDFWLV